jgi:hypothetical protein
MIPSLMLIEGRDDASVDLTTRMRAAIEAGVGFLMRAQVTDGPHAGAVPRAIRRLDSEPPDSKFNRRATEVRIDYVQHALSAWMQYLVLLDSDKKAATPSSRAGSPRKGR